MKSKYNFLIMSVVSLAFAAFCATSYAGTANTKETVKSGNPSPITVLNTIKWPECGLFCSGGN